MTAVTEPAPAHPVNVLAHHRQVDAAAAERAAADLVLALGGDLCGEALADTPRRVASLYTELLTPQQFSATTFPNDAAYDELVIVRDIPFTSLCEHHLLPFRGTASVGYLPATRIIGLSKLARLVEYFARRLQVQERMTAQVADWLRDQVAPRGVGVVVEAEHLCMTLRGVQATGTTTVTSTLYGLLRTDPAARQEFLHLSGALK